MTYYRPVTLTPREEQVARLMLKGHSAKEIARLLGNEARTVDQHIVNMKLKLGAGNRAHMVAHLLIRGIITATTNDL